MTKYSGDEEIAAEASRVELKGLEAAMAHLRLHDPDAQVLWETSGPRKSHIESIAQVIVEIDGVRRMAIVQSFASGAFKIYAEVPGKNADGGASLLPQFYA